MREREEWTARCRVERPGDGGSARANRTLMGAHSPAMRRRADRRNPQCLVAPGGGIVATTASRQRGAPGVGPRQQVASACSPAVHTCRLQWLPACHSLVMRSIRSPASCRGTPPLRSLGGAFAALDAIAAEVGALIRSRRMRDAILGLPPLDILELAQPAERERAMLLLCHLANAWVYGGEAPHLRIPPVLAIPLCALSGQLGRPPIAHYATMTLTNWRLIDPSAGISADNARTQVQFLGGVDEDWFFVASMGVELAGAPLVAAVVEAERAARDGSDADITAALERFAAGMPAVHDALQRVREWCDPHTYYLRVRPYVRQLAGARRGVRGGLGGAAQVHGRERRAERAAAVV